MCLCVRCVQLRDIIVFMIACGYIVLCMFARMLVNVPEPVCMFF